MPTPVELEVHKRNNDECTGKKVLPAFGVSKRRCLSLVRKAKQINIGIQQYGNRAKEGATGEQTVYIK